MLLRVAELLEEAVRRREVCQLLLEPERVGLRPPDQRADEPLMFISYDSQSGSNARCEYNLVGGDGKVLILNRLCSYLF